MRYLTLTEILELYRRIIEQSGCAVILFLILFDKFSLWKLNFIMPQYDRP